MSAPQLWMLGALTAGRMLTHLSFWLTRWLLIILVICSTTPRVLRSCSGGCNPKTGGCDRRGAVGAQVAKSAKQTQQRKAKGATTYGDEVSKTADAPRRWTDYSVHFEFPDPSDLGSASLIQLMDVDFQYPGREDFGLAGLNIGIDMGSRVAIVGPNGAGKTTLMNLLGGLHVACF